MNRKLVVFLVLVFLALPGYAFARVYDVKLSGAQEVPSNDSQATGECLAYLNGAADQLTVICQHDVQGATAAQIHRAPAEEVGPSILPFDSAVSPFKQTFSVTAQDVADLMAGSLYVNIYSPDFAGGEIRGQIGPPADGGVYFMLDGGQEVPAVDTQSSGACIGALDPLRTAFKLACSNDIADVTSVDIYRGMEGATGPMVFSLGASTTVFSEVSAGDLPDCPGLPGFLDDLWYGDLYVNVLSQTYPDGEIRGQIATPQLTLYFPQFGNGTVPGLAEGVTSSVVLVNTSTTTEASGVLSLFDTDGNPLDVTLTGGGLVGPVSPQSEFTFTLPPLGTATYTTDGQGDLVLGSAEVQSNVPLGGIIRFQLPGFGIAGFGAASPMVRAAVPVRKMGAIDTALAIRNDESWPIDVTLELLGEDGQAPAGSTAGSNIAEMSIPAKGRLAHFIDEYFLGSGIDLTDFSGTLMISTQDGSFSAIALEQGNAPGLFTSLPVSPVVGP
jgi:hypothetical protein